MIFSVTAMARVTHTFVIDQMDYGGISLVCLAGSYLGIHLTTSRSIFIAGALVLLLSVWRLLCHSSSPPLRWKQIKRFKLNRKSRPGFTWLLKAVFKYMAQFPNVSLETNQSQCEWFSAYVVFFCWQMCLLASWVKKLQWECQKENSNILNEKSDYQDLR